MEQRQLGRTGLRVSRLGLGTLTWGRDTDEHDAADQLKAFLEAGGTLRRHRGRVRRRRGRVPARAAAWTGWCRARDLVIATKAGSVPDPRPALRRLARAPAGRAGRLAGPARHRPRRPVAGARLRPDDAAGGDPAGAGHRGQPAAGPATPASPTSAAGSSPRPPPGSWRRPARGPGWPVPRWSTRCCSAASSARCCPPRSTWARPAAVVAAGPRGADRQVPPRHAGRTRAAPRSTSRRSSRRTSTSAASRIVDAVATAADGLGADRRSEVALAWVRDRPGVAAPIVGARNAQQLTAALSVESLSLPDEICQALDDVSAPVHRYPDQDWSTL